MVAESAAKRDEAAPFKEAPSTTSPAFFFPPNATIASFGHPGEQEYKFDGDKAIYVRLFPKTSEGQPKIGRSALKNLIHHRRSLNPMAREHGGIESSNDYGWVSIDPLTATTTKGISQAFPSGELWGVNSQVFLPVEIRSFIESAITFGVIGVEKLYTRTLENFVAVASAGMQLRPPFVVELGIVGTRGTYMGAPHPEFLNGNYYGPIHDDSLIRHYELADVSRAALLDILRKFFDDLYDLAECSRSEILTDEHVQKNDIPHRS
ncbi:MAG: hypothetical protein WA156_12430 [Methylocystis silviterrae]